jgi:hypothetical protein
VDDWRFSLGAGVRFGEIDGFLQVPAGGTTGTTSTHRPTFDEIGIDDVAVIELNAGVAWRRENFFLDVLWIRSSGDAVLDQPLLTQGDIFAAGTTVESDIRLDQYRLGYRHRFDLASDLAVSPLVAVTLLDFDYRLESPGGPEADRGFLKYAPQLGISVDWTPGGGRLDLELRAFLALPIDKVAEINDVELRLRYALIRDREGRW